MLVEGGTEDKPDLSLVALEYKSRDSTASHPGRKPEVLVEGYLDEDPSSTVVNPVPGLSSTLIPPMLHWQGAWSLTSKNISC